MEGEDFGTSDWVKNDTSGSTDEDSSFSSFHHTPGLRIQPHSGNRDGKTEEGPEDEGNEFVEADVVGKGGGTCVGKVVSLEEGGGVGSDGFSTLYDNPGGCDKTHGQGHDGTSVNNGSIFEISVNPEGHNLLVEDILEESPHTVDTNEVKEAWKLTPEIEA